MKGVRSALLAFIMGVALVSSWYFKLIISHACTIQTYSFMIDSCLSENAKDEIEAKIKQILAKKNTSLSKLKEQLMHDCVFIGECGIRLSADQTMHMNIIADYPICLVNGNQLLTTKNNLISPELFIAQLIKNLPNVRIPLHNNEQHQLFSWCVDSICLIDKELFNQFSLVCQMPTKCYLVNKQQPLFSICFHAQTIPTKEQIKACNIILNQLEQQEVFKIKKGKKAQSFIADLRFKNQIIVYSDKGEGDGKNFF